MKGLLGRRRLEADEALILPQCNSVHTWGMQFPIDLLFVTRDWRIVALKAQVPPWRVSPLVWRAWAVIECAAGTIQRTKVSVGDRLQIRPQTDFSLDKARHAQIDLMRRSSKGQTSTPQGVGGDSAPECGVRGIERWGRKATGP